MDADPSTTFGIEIKTIIFGDPDLPFAYQKSRWRHNVKSLNEAFAKVTVDNHVSLEEKQKEAYKEWYFTQDITVLTQRIVFHGWKNKLRQVFGILRGEAFCGKPSDTCSLQVYVAILPGWSASHVKGVARDAMRYKPEFEALAPRLGRDRVASAWAKTNSVEKTGDDNANPAPEAIQE
ncbi:hypothetical protein DL766_003766 [Monosporascus sp. MC13-8B]|uniref:Uncharacterized protein n=1 Tax=Monosporascus cannonballus TaxID=155416 RepID=A0ABY0HAL0_9PEZI|nr:hypothetical protein DL762_005043 [Monosporascus cannonballus]RYP01282.1 hypothetical protein DL763_000254 [Monosporascus cannonballus]RYP32877.1 hypothetical protein DL766_003766 [Monosporascus sp. MC13-8B]